MFILTVLLRSTIKHLIKKCIKIKKRDYLIISLFLVYKSITLSFFAVKKETKNLVLHFILKHRFYFLHEITLCVFHFTNLYKSKLSGVSFRASSSFSDFYIVQKTEKMMDNRHYLESLTDEENSILISVESNYPINYAGL